MTTTTSNLSKNILPVGADVYLKYMCPNTDCGDIHWITLKESKTKNYRIVCDVCGKVYRPKRVESFNLAYKEEKQQEQKQENKPEEAEFIKDAVDTLIKFGFSKYESEEMINQQWEKSKSTNPATLVKMALNFFGVSNE